MDYDQGKGDNDGVVLLTPDRIATMATHDLLHEIGVATRNKQIWDEGILDKLKTGDKEWSEDVEDDLVIKGELVEEQVVYVPKDRDLRGKVIGHHHNDYMAGHPGVAKTMELIARGYWWPKMVDDVKEYIAGCADCQSKKTSRKAPATQLEPHDVTTKPWAHITVDMITKLPESEGFDSIFTIVDKFTKMVIAVPCKEEGATALVWAKILRDQVFTRYGMPTKITSDRGVQFVNAFIKELYKMLNITGNPSTAYHPQTNGQTERMNHEIEQYFRLFINNHQDNWVDLLQLATFAINNRVSSATKHTPFYLNYGRHPNNLKRRHYLTKMQTVSDFVEEMEKLREETGILLKWANQRMEKHYNRKKGGRIEYQPGDKVWLHGSNIKTYAPSTKLAPKWYGPLEIIDKVGKAAYRIKPLPAWKSRKHWVFHETQFIPFVTPKWKSQKKPDPPPPVDVGGIEEYEVEQILGSRMYRRKLEYLVKWKGYGLEHNEWLPYSEIHADRLIKEFHKKNPNAIRWLAVTSEQDLYIPTVMAKVGNWEVMQTID